MSNLTRRDFVKRTAVAGAGVALLSKYGLPSAWAANNSGNLRKWYQPLRGLGSSGIPVATPTADPIFAGTDFYQIGVSEYLDQLHPQLGPTRLWGYHTGVGSQRHLGGVIIAQRGRPVRIRFTNNLVDAAGKDLKHIIPVDTTLPGANQAQNRVAVHLHGGLIPWISDGGPFDWWTPSGVSGLSFMNGPGSVLDNIPLQPMLPGQADYYYPNDQSTRLMWYHDHAHGTTRLNAYAGIATGYLILDSAFEDVKIFADANGKPMVPGLESTLPLVFQDKKFVSDTTPLTDPSWAAVARGDVQSPGSLWYEHIYDPKEFKLLKGGAYLPPPDPSCVAEFFGDTMLCNGTVYPYLTVEAKRYRFMILNACNARFMNLNLFQANPKNADGIDLDPNLLFPLNPPGPNMIQIGNECGYLVQEVTHVSPKPFNPLTLTGNLLLAPAERADLIIDFTGQAGNEFILYNDSPGPFPGGNPAYDYFLGNPANPIQPVTGQDKTTPRKKWSTGPDTRQVLRIKVIAAGIPDPQPVGAILNPNELDPPPIVQYANPLTQPLPIPNVPVRDITLNEEFDGWGRLTQTIGTNVPKIAGVLGRPYLDPPTETPKAGVTEVWRIWNLSADTHPLHFHLVNVQILQREAFTGDGLKTTMVPVGAPRGPELNEVGWKETVQCHPFEVTTVIMKFELPKTPFEVPSSPRATMLEADDGMDLPAHPQKKYHEFVYHCHILEHEEHDMMRPLVVEEDVPPAI